MKKNYVLVETEDSIYECDPECLAFLKSENIFVILLCMEAVINPDIQNAIEQLI